MTTEVCSLEAGHCKPCEGGIPKLTAEECTPLLAQIHDDWAVDESTRFIRREFSFKGFNKTMGFMNAVAWIANQEMHHPDFEVGYNYCHITLTTHAIDGLSENDFILAAKIDALLNRT